MAVSVSVKGTQTCASAVAITVGVVAAATENVLKGIYSQSKVVKCTVEDHDAMRRKKEAKCGGR